MSAKDDVLGILARQGEVERSALTAAEQRAADKLAVAGVVGKKYVWSDGGNNRRSSYRLAVFYDPNWTRPTGTPRALRPAATEEQP